MDPRAAQCATDKHPSLSSLRCFFSSVRSDTSHTQTSACPGDDVQPVHGTGIRTPMRRGRVLCRHAPPTPARAYSDCTRGDRRVNILKIVRLVGASEHLSEIFVSPSLFLTIRGCLRSAISGAAPDPDICFNIPRTPLPATRRSTAHLRRPLFKHVRRFSIFFFFFFIRNVKCVTEANTGAARGKRTDKPRRTRSDCSNTCYPEEALTGGTRGRDSVYEISPVTIKVTSVCS